MAVYYSPRIHRTNEEQRERIQDLKRQLEEEKNKVKHAQEEKVREVKNVMDEEQAKAASDKAEFEQKLQRQMQIELMTKMDAARKDFDRQTEGLQQNHKQELESQLQNVLREKRELEERVKSVKEKAREEFGSQKNNESDKLVREVFKLQEQLSKSSESFGNLKQENKRLKDDLLKQKAEYDKELNKTDRNLRVAYQKQSEEIKEQARQLTEKEKHLSNFKRKCTILEEEKKKLEDDLQLAKKGLPTTSGDRAQSLSPAMKSTREEELLMTNSELGLLVKRLKNEVQQLRKDKSIVEERCKVAEEVAEPLRKRREEDMRSIMELNHMVDSKEKQVQKIVKERNEIRLEKEKLKKDLDAEQAALARHKIGDKRDAEIARVKKLLGTKTKELEGALENNAMLNMELQKLKDETDRSRKDKAETRMTQLTVVSPRSPAVERKVKEHRRLVELEQSNKEMSGKLDESQRSKARLNQRMEDLNESMRRRDKRIKVLSDENHKLKSSNQSMEEARDRTHRETIEEWTRTRTELDRAHAQINRLQQENMSLQDELSRFTSTGIISPLHLTPRRSPRSRSKSPSPVYRTLSSSPHSSSPQHRARSLSPMSHVPVQKWVPHHTLPISPSYQPRSSSSSPVPPTTRLDNTKIPVPTYHTLPMSPHSRTPSPLSNYSSPFHITIRVPIAEVEPELSSDESFGIEEDQFGSQSSLESLKDKIELYEFEKEETKIWQEEHVAEFGLLKGKYNILKERYNSLLERTKSISKKLQLTQKEKLEVDREFARLHKEKGGEFDVKRETNLRERLTQANLRVKKLEEELEKQSEQVDHMQERERREEQLLLDNSHMKIQLTELSLQLEQLENQLGEREEHLKEKEKLVKTKEKQMVGLERMLAEKEGELEGERAVASSLQQQQLLQKEMDLGRKATLKTSPGGRHFQGSPQLARCLQTAQNVTDKIKNTVTSKPTDNQIGRIQGLIDYLHKVIEEAKGYVEQTATPTATPTEGFEEPDVGAFVQQSPLNSAAAEERGRETLLQQELTKSEDETTSTISKSEVEEGTDASTSQQSLAEPDAPNLFQQQITQLMSENSSLKLKIAELEARQPEGSHTPTTGNETQGICASPPISVPSIKNGPTEHKDLFQQQKMLFETEKNSLISQNEKLEMQLAQMEAEVKNVNSELKKHLSIDAKGSSRLPPPKDTATEKDDWFQQWMARFDSDKKSMKSRIRELETRLVDGSQRVVELQELVSELEGRLKETENLSISPSAIQDRDKYITSLTEQISILSKATPPPLFPPSLGLQVSRTFQQTQHAVGRGDLSQSRLELQNLEVAISQLLNAAFPQGLVIPVSPHQGDTNREDPRTLTVSSFSSPLASVSPSSPPYAPPICPSPVPVSSEEEPIIPHKDTKRVFPKMEPDGVTVTPQTKRTKKKTKADLRLFVALLDYNPLSLCSTGHPERELTLHTGDVIAVTGEMDSEGCYTGIFEGRRGLVPTKFLEEMEVNDKEAQQRLLNQSLSHSLSPSLHGSDIDITSSPSPSHKTTPTSVKLVPSRHTTSPPQGTRPSPPSHFKAVQSAVDEDSILVTWRPPSLDSEGRSNGYLVTGYMVTCDGVKRMEIGPRDKQVLLVGVDPLVPHPLSICTRSEEGVSSIVITCQYIMPEPYARLRKGNDMIRANRRSIESLDSDILRNKLMIAVFDYTPETDSPNPEPDLELPFTKGQIITVYGDMRDDGFYHGEVGGRFGLVPSNFVVDFDPEDSEGTHQPSVPAAVAMTINPSHAQTQSPQSRSGGSRRKLFKAQES